MHDGITAPIVILGVPRSGTTILHRSLAMHPQLWHLPSESHAILEGPLHPERTGYRSNRVTATDVDEETVAQLRRAFFRQALNLNAVMADPSPLEVDGGIARRAMRAAAVGAVGWCSTFRKGPSIRFLEKTPKNSLRVPFLDRLFPDAWYVVQRNAPENVDSLVAGWHAIDRIGPFRRQRFARAGYPIADTLHLQDYPGKWWKFALVPEWRMLQNKTVADVAAWQYHQCNHFLGRIWRPWTSGVHRVRYEDCVREPVSHVREIFRVGRAAAEPDRRGVCRRAATGEPRHAREDPGPSGHAALRPGGLRGARATPPAGRRRTMRAA